MIKHKNKKILKIFQKMLKNALQKNLKEVLYASCLKQDAKNFNSCHGASQTQHFGVRKDLKKSLKNF